jgi:hypothetical protein
MNDDQHRLAFYVQSDGGQFVRMIQGDWVDGPAGRRTFGVGQNRTDGTTDGTLLSNTTYRIVLETINGCGVLASEPIEFTTGSCDIQDDDGGGVIIIPEGNFRVYPNPTNNGSTLEYEVLSSTEIEIYWAGVGPDGHYLPLQQYSNASGPKSPGNYSVQFTDIQLKTGVNYIVLKAGNEVHIRRVSKN